MAACWLLCVVCLLSGPTGRCVEEGPEQVKVSVADFLQKSWLSLHFCFDVIQHRLVIRVNNDIHVFDGIVNFPDADLQFGA